MSNLDNTTLTHHMVDNDLPSELAISRFIQLSPYTRYLRQEETVVYNIFHLAFAEARLREAKEIIKQNRLPLLDDLRKSPVDALLIIKVKQ